MHESTYRHIVNSLHLIEVNLATGEVPNSFVNKRTGYVQVFLNGKSVYVHHVVAIAGGLDPRNKTVNHIDMNKRNNAFSNLEVLTNRENVRKAGKAGLMAKRSPKLSDEEVREIRRLGRLGLSNYQIADMFGRSFKTISRIRLRKVYKDVPDYVGNEPIVISEPTDVRKMRSSFNRMKAEINSTLSSFEYELRKLEKKRSISKARGNLS